MKNKFIYKFAILLMVNFGALALGNAWTSSGITSEWYTTANQAPWTPPGWVFGAAWFAYGVSFPSILGPSAFRCQSASNWIPKASTPMPNKQLACYSRAALEGGYKSDARDAR